MKMAEYAERVGSTARGILFLLFLVARMLLLITTMIIVCRLSAGKNNEWKCERE